jgi:hypothetical protein
MTTRGMNGLRSTEPIETPVPAVAETDPSAGWEAWLRARLDTEREGLGAHLVTERDSLIEIIGETLGTTRKGLMELIEPLQREVAELRGAMDVMRSLGHAGLRLRGSYDPAAAYLAHDVVMHEGSSFIARKDKAGTCPGEDWQLLASKGDLGRPGPRGVRGMTGGRGEPAPRIKAWLVDKAKFTASPILTDRTVGAPLELKSLFQEFLDQTRAGA